MGDNRFAGKIADGWFLQSNTVISPNADARPEGESIRLLVIHNISLPPGRYGGSHIVDFFTNNLKVDQDPYFDGIAGLKVSAHLLIDRNGTVTQFVSFDHRAWHAGESSFDRAPACNDFSIGIEMEGTDIEPYTDNQYHCLAEVSAAIMAAYPRITFGRIVGHRDIAPGRKTDPGLAFDWYRYFHLLKEKG